MSKDKTRPITILVIDDESDFVEKSLRPVGRDKRIKIEHRTNLAEGRKALEENKSIAGVILDVKCRLRPEDSADAGFIGKALDFMNTSFPDMPRVILTGDPGIPVQLKAFHTDEKVYEKREDDIERMLEILKKDAEDNEFNKVARKFKDIFDLFDAGYFDDATRNDLYETLKTMHDKQKIGENLRRIRPMQEAIYHELYKFDGTIIPLEYLDKKYNPDPKADKNRGDIIGHLIKNGAIEGRESIVYREGELIQRITSHYASHKQLEQPKFPPTIYTVQMCVFAILDLFMWFKSIVAGERKLSQ